MKDSPSPNDPNARGRQGRFAPGNQGGPGNPYAKRVGELRAALFEAVTPSDLKVVLLALLSRAKAGDVASIRELLQRLLGPPESADLIDRLIALEQATAQSTSKIDPPGAIPRDKI